MLFPLKEEEKRQVHFRSAVLPGTAQEESLLITSLPGLLITLAEQQLLVLQPDAQEQAFSMLAAVHIRILSSKAGANAAGAQQVFA